VVRSRVVLSGAAPIPWRCPDVENAVMGRSLDDEIVARAASVAMQAARPLRHNDYKIELFKGLLAEELAAYTRH
jgi:xanthine dehydrogenase YagS FAD-binding subunit